MNKRREKILEVIEKCDFLCDVGCDHGYVGFEVLKRNISKKVIFTDISSPSLEKARKLIAQENLTERAEFLHTFGVDGVNEQNFTILIAGMGGEEIIKILSKSVAENGVLQPMSETEKLRVFLVESGKKILIDKLFYDKGKYYNLIKFETGKDSLSIEEELFGRSNLNCPEKDFIEYMSKRLERQREIQKKRNEQNDNDEKLIKFMERFLEEKT